MATIAEVLDSVADDPQLAQEALDAELASDSPRSTLIAQLEAIIDAEPEPEEPVKQETPKPSPVPDVYIDLSDNGVHIGRVHVRDEEVEVPDANVAHHADTPTLVAAEQVLYFQGVGATNGIVIVINGAGFAFGRQFITALKQTLDQATVGLSL